MNTLLLSALYYLTAVGAIALAIFEWRKMPKPKHPWIWALLAICLFFVGWPSHYTVMGDLTQVIRDKATAEGWYNNRLVFQERVMLGGAVSGAILVISILIYTRKVVLRYAVAILAIALYSGLILIELLSEHYSGLALIQMVGPVNVYTWCLLFGLILSAGSAGWVFYTNRKFLKIQTTKYFSSPNS